MWNPFRRKPKPQPDVEILPPVPVPPPAPERPKGIVVTAVGHAGPRRKRAGPGIEDVMSAAVIATTERGLTDAASMQAAMQKARADLKAAWREADAKKQTVIVKVGSRNFTVPPA